MGPGPLRPESFVLACGARLCGRFADRCVVCRPHHDPAEGVERGQQPLHDPLRLFRWTVSDFGVQYCSVAAEFLQMMKLVRRVRSAARGDRTMDWFKPFMARRRCSGGQFLFRKGDDTNTMYYIVSGCFCIFELGIQMMPGEFVGELGLLASDSRRTQSLECVDE